MHRVRLAPTSAHADECALVLTAAGIPNAVEPAERGWAVLVAPDDMARAEGVLAAWDDERPEEPRADRPGADALDAPYPWMSGIALGLLILWLFTVTGVPGPASPWFQHGTALAGRIASGETWRAVTALTLHVDVVHALGNACALAVLLPPLAQRFGVGIALLLLLASGAGGNVLAALVHDARHSGVGASTAAFGAVGILVALRLRGGEGPQGRKRWTAPIAGMVLVGFFSAAPRVDIAAHAFGFVAGVAVGAAGAATVRTPAGKIAQWIAGGVTGALVALCWWVALRSA